MTSTKLPDPTNLRDYLRSLTWTVLPEAINDRLYVLSNAEYPFRQMVFPMDASAPDYAESVTSVVEKVSDLTGDNVDTLLFSINAVKDDVLRVRISYEGDDTSLPLSFATSVIQSTEKMLRASACTVVRPRTRHPKLTLSEAAQLVEEARFGQTAEGSFILQVACPINAMDAQGTLELDEPSVPFVRQVTSSLETALGKIVNAIEADTLEGLVNELRSSDRPLVSSNLCEAVLGMHDSDINNSIDFGFKWSALRPRPSARSTTRFQRDYFSRVEEIGRELRAEELNDAETYFGTVERLDGEMGPDGKRSGLVVLALLSSDEGEAVRARVVLSAEDYGKADRAHMTNGAYVRITGRLLPGRQPRQLVDMSRFEVFNP